MKGMNKPSLDAIRAEAMKLHFQQALDLLNLYTLQELGFDGLLLKSKILRGTYAYASALEYALMALDGALPGKQTLQALLEQARCLFALNRSDEALEILQTLTSNRHPSAEAEQAALLREARIQTALICSEIGRVDEALAILEDLPVVTCSEESGEEEIRKLVDSLCLQGDLYSYKASMPGAEQSEWFNLAEAMYGRAMETCELLPASDFRSLRLSLVYNNRADLYEGLELFEEAAQDYDAAMNLAEPIEDPQIFDLNGYKADLLMSLGNLYALREDEVTAQRLLEKARGLIDEIHNVQQDSYLAKCLYLQGMCRLYSSEDAAQEDLENSCHLYEKLVSEGRDKEERLANARFYLAGVLSDSDENLERNRRLYGQILPVYERIWQRNPELYLSNMASLYNDLGRISYYQKDPDRAIEEYQQGLELYTQLYRLDEEDLFALFNLVVTRFNLISASCNLPQEQLAGLHMKLALEELRLIRRKTTDYDSDIWSLLSASRETLLEQLPDFAEEYDQLQSSLSQDHFLA